METINWKHCRVLVTGAGGFIGSHLVERLVSLGADTKAFIQYNSTSDKGWLERSDADEVSDVEFFFGDIRDPESMASAFKGVDIVFHLAALIGIPYSYESPQSYVRTNMEGTLNVLRSTMACNAGSIVHTSTSEVYGTAVTHLIDETHRLQAQSPYAASKIAADKLAESFHLSFGLPVATIRPFNTFGPRQSMRAVLPTIVSQAISGQRIYLGNLDAIRDFNYVQDTVDGFIKVGESPAAIGEVINIGSGREISIGKAAQLILEMTRSKGAVEVETERVRPLHSEVMRLCADNSKAKRILGWEPNTTLEQGLGFLISWMEKNIASYRSSSYHV